MSEYTGKDVSYYLVPIPHPKRLDPYTAECEDIIEALGMTFAEGCAFKAIWRKCAARTLGLAKTGYKGGLYDAEKTEYYGARMVAQEKRQTSAADPRACPYCGVQELALHRPDCQLMRKGKSRFSNAFHAALQASMAAEPASEIDDDSPRQQAIAQNGNTGEHYESVAPADPDGWIEWDGGTCPVELHVTVHYVTRGGICYTTKAARVSWKHRGDARDVMKYRLAK